MMIDSIRVGKKALGGKLKGFFKRIC
jgi:hypothetical protein